MSLFNVASNVERKPFGGIKLLRSAGSSGIISQKNSDSLLIKLINGLLMNTSNNCMCAYGQVSNSRHRFYKFLHAGDRRALGIRPTVRGVAMNPHDHPHGGGEGKKASPAAARSP
jgi:large subunit ribosomal protein L2